MLLRCLYHCQYREKWCARLSWQQGQNSRPAGLSSRTLSQKASAIIITAVTKRVFKRSQLFLEFTDNDPEWLDKWHCSYLGPYLIQCVLLLQIEEEKLTGFLKTVALDFARLGIEVRASCWGQALYHWAMSPALRLSTSERRVSLDALVTFISSQQHTGGSQLLKGKLYLPHTAGHSSQRLEALLLWASGKGGSPCYLKSRKES